MNRPSKPKPTAAEHHFDERFARDQMLALLNIGTPYPACDIHVNYRPTIAQGKRADIHLLPTQEAVYYQIRDELGQVLLDEAGKPDPILADQEGTWEVVTLQSPPIQEDTSFSVQAARSWTQSHLRQLFMIDGRVGWIVGDGIILYTDNGGVSWSIQASALWVQQSLQSVFFLDRFQGWVGGEHLILHTLDGGNSWTPQLEVTRLNIHSIHFADTQLGWAFGLQQWYRTTNGGKDWDLQEEFSEDNILAVAVHEQVFMAVGEHGRIYRTEDAGASWMERHLSPLSLPQALVPIVGAGLRRPNLFGIFMSDADETWVVGSGGLLLHTIDAGLRWQRVDTGTTSDLKAIQFINQQDGWICGTDGSLLRTLDAGQTWQQQMEEKLTPFGRQAGAHLASLWVTEKQIRLADGTDEIRTSALAVGVDGTILQSTHASLNRDGGPAIWTPKQLSVLLHKTINIRLGIITDLAVSFDPVVEQLHEIIVPYGDRDHPIFVFESQEGVSYQLVSRKKDNRRAEALVDEIWSEPEPGTNQRIAINLTEDKRFTEDISLWLESFRTLLPFEFAYQELPPDGILQVYVQPNDELPLQLIPEQPAFGEAVTLRISDTQESVQYQVFAYVPDQGKYLPSSLEVPATSHPALARSYRDKAVILEELGRLEAAKAHYLKAIEKQSALYPDEHPDLATFVDDAEFIQLLLEEEQLNMVFRHELRSVVETPPSDMVEQLDTASELLLDAYLLQQDGEGPLAVEFMKEFQLFESQPQSVPAEFEKLGLLTDGNGGVLEIELNRVGGWQEDALLLVVANKKEGKGGSLILKETPIIRVMPRIEEILLQSEPSVLASDGMPTAIILSKTQYDVAYHPIPPQIATTTAAEMLTGLDSSNRGIGWEGFQHAFGMRVGIDLTIGTLKNDAFSSLVFAGIGDGEVGFTFGVGPVKELIASNATSPEAIPPFETQEHLFPSKTVWLPLHSRLEEAGKVNIKAIKTYSGLEADLSIQFAAISGFLELDGVSMVSVRRHLGVLGRGPRTVEALIRTDEAGGAIVSWGRRGQGSKWIIRLNRARDPELAGRLRLEVGHGFVVGQRALHDNLWHHVAVVFDPSTQGITIDSVRLFVDGEEEQVGRKHTHEINTLAQQEVIIGSDHRGNFFDGAIAEVRLWDRARSAAGLKAFATQRITEFDEDLVGYWKLNRPEHDLAKDSSGNHQDGDVIGGVWR